MSDIGLGGYAGLAALLTVIAREVGPRVTEWIRAVRRHDGETREQVISVEARLHILEERLRKLEEQR